MLKISGSEDRLVLIHPNLDSGLFVLELGKGKPRGTDPQSKFHYLLTRENLSWFVKECQSGIKINVATKNITIEFIKDDLGMVVKHDLSYFTHFQNLSEAEESIVTRFWEKHFTRFIKHDWMDCEV